MIIQDELNLLKAKMKEMENNVTASYKLSSTAMSKANSALEKVEKLERNSRSMNMIISGFVKEPHFVQGELREEKCCLKKLLENGT